MIKKLTENFKNNFVKEKKFWIFQANPERFNASHWWHALQTADQWRIKKRHRDKILKMGINAIWTSMIDEDDVWLIQPCHQEKIVAKKNLEAMLLAEKFDYWSIFEHKNKINKGDMAAIWVAGKSDFAGIYAIAEVVSDPYFPPLPRNGNINYWKREKDRKRFIENPWLIVSIRYIKLVNPPWAPLISRSSILEDDELTDLVILRSPQGTNFGPIPKKQWLRILELLGLSS